ncbi:PH domain-containing protein [Carnobacterium gallinarum]|uniref:PH domain-containing protein n=1 Tax=Carnobacterium gallinarum TaxID=2749 RepID=UPI0005540957|nr:PH domain-containing protein [Carnobacterium gallinarum]
MGLFSGLISNASDSDSDATRKKLADVLLPSENIELAYKLVRDMIVFTDKRLIIIDKQGMTGKKISYKTYPYRSISRFTVETSGHFDLDAELSIFISSAIEPAETLTFSKDRHIVEIQQALAQAIL